MPLRMLVVSEIFQHYHNDALSLSAIRINLLPHKMRSTNTTCPTLVSDPFSSQEQIVIIHPQNVQLQNVHLPDVQLQNVQITKRPDYQTSLFPNVQLQNVHTSNYYKTSSFFLFSNTDNYDGFSPLKKYVLYLTLT
jgi:hypothetical protein